MSNRIDIIKEGYCRELSTGRVVANGTSTLIRANGINVVFDTLNPWDRQYMIDRLDSFGLSCADISQLVCSHTHTDHIGNLNLFTNCQHIVGDHVYREDVFQLDAFKDNKTIDISEDMRIVSTPGHTKDSISLVVTNVDKLGTVGITGDLFECESDLLDDNIWINAGSEDSDKQRQNRQIMSSLCDYIIPGHGVMFRVRR